MKKTLFVLAVIGAIIGAYFLIAYLRKRNLVNSIIEKYNCGDIESTCDASFEGLMKQDYETLKKSYLEN